jgi:hypothetical protein
LVHRIEVGSGEQSCGELGVGLFGNDVVAIGCLAIGRHDEVEAFLDDESIDDVQV